MAARVNPAAVFGNQRMPGAGVNDLLPTGQDVVREAMPGNPSNFWSQQGDDIRGGPSMNLYRDGPVERPPAQIGLQPAMPATAPLAPKQAPIDMLGDMAAAGSPLMRPQSQNVPPLEDPLQRLAAGIQTAFGQKNGWRMPGDTSRFLPSYVDQDPMVMAGLGAKPKKGGGKR
jgi:hypothetical protein